MYESLRAKLYKKVIKESRDLFKEGIVPLGMAKPIENYMRLPLEEFEKSDEFISYEIDNRNLLAGLVLSPSGYGKGRLTKNIVRAYHNAGWKILVVDAKAHEFLSASKKGNGRRLHPFMENSSLPVVGYVPSYVESEIPEHLKSKFRVYSHSVLEFKTREHWSSLGFSSKSADFCVMQIENGVDDIKLMESRLEEDDTLLGITKKAGLSAMALIQGTRFFNRNRKELDIKKHWDNNEIISLSYFSKGGNLMATDVGIIIQKVKDIGVEELKKGTQFVTKKLIVLDDALYYLDGTQVKAGETSLAIKETLNIMNNYRSFGLNVIIEVQSTSLIDFKIVESCTKMWIGKIKRPSSVMDIVNKDVYQILNSSGMENEPDPLMSNQDSFIREWIFVDGDNFERFIPFDCTLGHE